MVNFLSADEKGIVVCFNQRMAVKLTSSVQSATECFDLLKRVFEKFTLFIAKFPEMTSRIHVPTPNQLMHVDPVNATVSFVQAHTQEDQGGTYKLDEWGRGFQSAYAMERVFSKRVDGLQEHVFFSCNKPVGDILFVDNDDMQDMTRVMTEPEKFKQRPRGAFLCVDDLLERNYIITDLARSVGLLHGIAISAGIDPSHVETVLDETGKVVLYSVSTSAVMQGYVPTKETNDADVMDMYTSGIEEVLSQIQLQVQQSQESPEKREETNANFEIKLTDVEKKIFDMMLTVAHPTNTVVRCVGGWVRDKLLGKDSDDLDIALDNMMGKEFAERLMAYKDSIDPDPLKSSKISVIAANPEKSKNLETATVTLMGTSLDFVNLRIDTPISGSRIPETKFGTAEQDALRRDLTINSMFFNLNTGKIEDLTGMGRTDLKNHIIRTPMGAAKTFTDDPLRVLRAVRFAARFSMSLNEDLVKAASSVTIKKTLLEPTMISRERIGSELEGMLGGPAPATAIALLESIGLMDVIFLAKISTMNASDKISKGVDAAAILGKKLDINAQRKREYFLAATLMCLTMDHPDVKSQSLEAIITQNIKWTKRTAASVISMMGVAKDLADLYKGDCDDDEFKIALGWAVSRLDENWMSGFALAPLLNFELSIDGKIEMRDTLIGCVEEFGLQESWRWKKEQLMNGNDVREAINYLRANPEMRQLRAAFRNEKSTNGPGMKDALRAIMEWRFLHPTGSKEACREALVEWLSSAL